MSKVWTELYAVVLVGVAIIAIAVMGDGAVKSIVELIKLALSR